MGNWDQLVGSILEPVLELDPRIGAGVEGCTPEDVAAIELKYDLTLPPAFVALIARIGRSRGHLFKGADFGYPEMLSYRETAEHLLAEHGGLGLHPLDLVYEMHQGYQFFFFRADGAEDPAIHLYNDDDPGFVSLGMSLTEWLKVCMEEEAALWKQALAWEGRGHTLSVFRRDG